MAARPSARPNYWLPAGRVDAGESLEDAARRESEEEAGVNVRPTGVVRFMVDDDVAPSVMRVVLTAEADEDDPLPKSVPDWESAGALWCDLPGLAALRTSDFRSPDPLELFPRVASRALPPASLDTPAWRALEALLRRLTRGDAAAQEELPTVWAAIKATYPGLVV